MKNFVKSMKRTAFALIVTVTASAILFSVSASAQTLSGQEPSCTDNDIASVALDFDLNDIGDAYDCASDSAVITLAAPAF